MTNNLNNKLNKLEHQFAEKSTIISKNPIYSGIDKLDNLLGSKGFPRGNLVELFGKSSTGKTLLSYYIVKKAQQSKQLAVWIDLDNCFDGKYAEELGILVNELLVIKLTNIKELEQILLQLLDGGVDVIIIDSIASSNSIDIILNTVSGLSKSSSCLIYTNQIRNKLYTHSITSFGNKRLKFFTSLRIELSKVKLLKQDHTTIGRKIKARIVKNRFYIPFKECEFNLIFNKGIES